MTRAMVLALLLAAAQAWGQSPFAGAVPRGEVSPEALPLSLENAIARGIQTNLGLILSQESARAAEGGYLGVRSRLLPNLEARIGESSQQVNLEAFGFSSFPGIPQIRTQRAERDAGHGRPHKKKYDSPDFRAHDAGSNRPRAQRTG